MLDDLNDIFIWAQIVACFAMSLQIFAMQLKRSRTIILVHCPIGLLWGIQYLMLSAPMGAFFSLFAAAKDLLVAYTSEKFIKIIIYSFILTLWGIGLFMFKAWHDTLPLLAGTIMNLAMLRRDSRHQFARAKAFTQILWFSYNITVGAWIGLTCSLLVFTSTLIGMYRHEEWEIGKCYRSFLPSLGRSLFLTPRTFP